MADDFRLAFIVRVAITGGPGVGKTTLLAELSRRGYETSPESAREVIRERVAHGLSPRPGPAVFAAQILARDIAKHQETASRLGPVFFDRSAVESLAMVADAAVTKPDDIDGMLELFRYHCHVFVLPPWREIYVTDTERDQSFAEAERVDRRVRDCYRNAGYALIDVPRTAVAERADFVLRWLAL